MKPHTWIVFALALTAAGCAVSDDTAAGDTGQTSANQWQWPVLLTLNAAEQPADEDFDLLETEITEQKVKVADPLEPLNRLTYGFNDILHCWVLRPCAEGCKALVPEPVRVGAHNFFHNLTTPARFVNCLLQGKGDAGGTEFDRFLINTTVGILGFGDPARDQYGLEPVDEDLGQTLAVYGLENGFYVVLPLFGPSTLRDSLGRAGDLFLNPISYVEPAETAIGVSAGKHINESSFHIGQYESFKAAAIDPYVAMRDAYIQYRNNQIQQ